MAVIELVDGSQVIPGQEAGQVFKSGKDEELHKGRILPSGSEVIPFLNSSKDRSWSD